MNENKLSKRKSLRLKDYDYSQNGVLWQRGYIDHIIRNQTDFEHHWNYIEYNALKEYK